MADLAAHQALKARPMRWRGSIKESTGQKPIKAASLRKNPIASKPLKRLRDPIALAKITGGLLLGTGMAQATKEEAMIAARMD
jgi:hypothetical protein